MMTANIHSSSNAAEQLATSHQDAEDALDAGNYELRPAFRQALEDAVIEGAAHSYSQRPDSLRLLLKEGLEGVSKMSDSGLLDYAIHSIALRAVDGHSLRELASLLDEASAHDEQEYRVAWEMDISAVNPAQAARRARDHMRKAASTANVFEVQNRAVPEEVVLLDLQELDEERFRAACPEAMGAPSPGMG